MAVLNSPVLATDPTRPDTAASLVAVSTFVLVTVPLVNTVLPTPDVFSLAQLSGGHAV